MRFRVERHNSKLERAPRAERACVSCHTRKVRCDVSPSKPLCTNCQRDGRSCEPRLRQQRSKNGVKSASTGRNPSHSKSTRMLTQPQERMTIAQSPQLQISTQDADHGARPQSACNADLGPDGSRESPPNPSHAPEATRVSNVNESGFMERSSYIAPDRFQAEDGSEIYYATQSSSEITSKILDLHKALELPPRAVRDGLFANFWAYCYPWDPIIEKSQVIGVSLEKLSPLLLQAIFLAGSRMSSASASYATPQEFYKRAKTLFYLNTEQDPLTLLTAVSLLHWSNPHGPERVSTDTSSFWCRVAVSLAQQMGLHSQKKRVHDESLRRRIWWSLVVRLTCVLFE